jgi:type I restriction enzyme S subunit
VVDVLGRKLNIFTGKANARDNEDNGLYPLFDRSEVIKKSNKYIFDNEALIYPGEGQNFVGKYYKGKYNLHQRAYCLTDFYKNINCRYLQNTLNRCKADFMRLSVGSTVPSLRKPIFEKFEFLNPNIQEQDHISQILTSQEDLISSKKELLEKYKKQQQYMNQELLSGRLRIKLTDNSIKEGVKLGLLEAKVIDKNETFDTVEGKNEDFQEWLEVDFSSKIEFYKNADNNWKNVKVNYRLLKSIPTDWLMVKLDSVLKGKVGFTPPTNNPNNFIGTYHWIKISDMGEKMVNTNKTLNNSLNGCKNRLLEKNSLLYSFKLSVGIVGFTTSHNMITNEAIIGFEPSKNDNLSYFYYILKKYLHLNAGKNAYGADLMNQTLIKNADLIISNHSLEQTLIATKLTQLYNIIENLEKEMKLEETKFTFLKQELLSGRIRVK